MTGIYGTLSKVTWGLGVIALILGVLARIVNLFGNVDWRFTPRGALVIAAVLFLCAIATREVGRAESA